MSELQNYKCPNCGGRVEFDPQSGKMKCSFCDSIFEISDFETPDAQNVQNTTNTNNNEWGQGETDNLAVYVCDSCGGEIIADKTTGATVCPFCENPVTMKGQFAGTLRPNYVIPFAIDKKGAKECYKNHLTGRKFMPKVFKDENHIDEIKGIYVPFWLFDINLNAAANFEGKDISVTTVGDTEYTTTRIYNCQRNATMMFNKVPTDASSKMPDDLTQSVEPFDTNNLKPFSTAYLSGYAADKYDVEQNECMPIAIKRIENSAVDELKSTVMHESVTVLNKNVNLLSNNCNYALYPIWLLNTTWNDEHFVFAINGDSGKAVGNLPFDSAAFTVFVITRTLILFVIGIIIRLIMIKL